jgi:hypothetical protein
MTVIQSASGSRIDCDHCAHHCAAPSRSIEALRRMTGYIHHGGRDYCPACWYAHTASRFGSSATSGADDGSTAA